MGYIIALVVLAIIVPLLFVLLGRRSSASGMLDAKPKSGGVTPSRPSSDQPTPGAGSVNQAIGTGREVPPG